MGLEMEDNRIQIGFRDGANRIIFISCYISPGSATAVTKPNTAHQKIQLHHLHRTTIIDYRAPDGKRLIYISNICHW